MSDPKNIKDQKKVKSGGVTPKDASKKIEEIRDDELGKVTGGTVPKMQYLDLI